MMMSASLPNFLLLAAVCAGLCLLALSRVRSAKFHERGLLVVSTGPRLHVCLAYGVALYIRCGFGSWPRSCVDNPALPGLGVLLPLIILGLLVVLLFLPFLWVGWTILRQCRGQHRFNGSAASLFLSGLGVEIAAHFLDWVWD